ncbi:hypothetical protein KC338_g24 [Hortaea werneckii]|nr:hypothetical protein KC338_g24 [Hortaea werneckii]
MKLCPCAAIRSSSMVCLITASSRDRRASSTVTRSGRFGSVAPTGIGTEPRLVQKTCHNRPRRISGPSRKADTIGAHPVRSHHTKDIDRQFNRHALPAIRRLRELRVPYLPHH